MHNGKEALLLSPVLRADEHPFPWLLAFESTLARSRSRSASALRTQVFSAPNYVDQAGNKGAFVRQFRTQYQWGCGSDESFFRAPVHMGAGCRPITDSNRRRRQSGVHSVRRTAAPADEAHGVRIKRACEPAHVGERRHITSCGRCSRDGEVSPAAPCSHVPGVGVRGRLDGL